MKKWVYLFTEGNANMRELLGGKGANLAEMTNIGLPVPQGFTITTEACTQYYEDGREINEEIQGQINEYITKMEEITGKKFGDHENPLWRYAFSCPMRAASTSGSFSNTVWSPSIRSIMDGSNTINPALIQPPSSFFFSLKFVIVPSF